MKTIQVEPQPSFAFGVKRIVRVLDVWHNDAFTGTPAEGAGVTGTRELKWYCEDFAGNLIWQWQPTSECPFGGDDTVTIEWVDGAWHWTQP